MAFFSPLPTVRQGLHALLQQRSDVVRLACVQRARFEGWLKFELAAALQRETQIHQVTLEDGYPAGGRCDISFECHDEKWYLEMKTANTNWRADGLQNRTRPITKNINGIADDIQVLQRKSPPSHGMMVFCIFPIPKFLWENRRDDLTYHLERIEAQSELEHGMLSKEAAYIPVAEEYGMCAFVVEVV